MYGNPFTDKWPGFDTAHIGYVFTLKLKPGQTAALMTFVAKGKQRSLRTPRAVSRPPFAMAW